MTRTTASKKVASKSNGRRPPPRRSEPRDKPKATDAQTIHCTLARTGDWSMVLPTSAIAEITDYAPPAPLDNMPQWLLGQVEWEDWQVPVISYGALIEGKEPETATATSRIMVVRSLSSATRVPFIGVLVREIPRLANVSSADLEVTGEDGRSLSVHCKVKLGDLDAVIPDLDRLSQLVGHAAYGTVDKGQAVAEA